MDTTRSGTTEGWSGETAQPAQGFQAGDVIDGRYRVVEEIGHGGMGTVLQVEGVIDGHPAALKYCRLGGLESKRFAREVRLMGRVRHPHVAAVVFANLRHDPPYFVMPLAEGSLLGDLSRLKGDEPEALATFRQVCLGIRALHDSGIVHRDIKPANVLRFPGGRFAVADLGLAKLESRDTTVLTRTQALVGTLQYLAPEQFLPAGSRRADARTDIFQLGKLLYQLLTDRPPGLIEPDALPKGLGHILQRATSVNPDDRYQTLGEFLDALRYYELSKDPAQNCREAFENLVLQVEDLLRRREHSPELIRETLALLSRLQQLDRATPLGHFDRLPDGLLPVLAREFTPEFVPVLKSYAEAIQSRVARCNFAYADTVARRMRTVFQHASHPALKRVALQIVLIAAVELNRFAAMGVFNRLLVGVQAVELALPVAEMLREFPEYYQEVAGAVPPDRLHPAIREIQKDVLAGTEDFF